jgi:hypothetical protein
VASSSSSSMRVGLVGAGSDIGGMLVAIVFLGCGERGRGGRGFMEESFGRRIDGGNGGLCDIN